MKPGWAYSFSIGVVHLSGHVQSAYHYCESGKRLGSKTCHFVPPLTISPCKISYLFSRKVYGEGQKTK